jgi:hypothetical protein
MKLFSTPVTTIHDPRGVFHGSRSNNPVSGCVGLCQVCVGFTDLLFPLLSYTYAAFSNLCQVFCDFKVGRIISQKEPFIF